MRRIPCLFLLAALLLLSACASPGEGNRTPAPIASVSHTPQARFSQSPSATAGARARNRLINEDYEAARMDDTILIVDYRETAARPTDTLILDSETDGGETITFLPVYTGTVLEVERVRYDAEHARFFAQESVYSLLAGDSCALALTVIEAEDLPVYRVTASFEGKTVFFLIAYNASGLPLELDGISVIAF